MEQAGSPDLPPFLKTGGLAPTAIVQTAETVLPVPFRMAAAPARPGHIAEREELDEALKTGTPEALQQFLERHPDSRYRAQALDALHRLNPTQTR